MNEQRIAPFMAMPAYTLDAIDRIDSEESLLAFVRRLWLVLEPGRRLVEGWPLLAICEHLEAVSDGLIQKLLITVPPGFMKSLLTNVFWPAWTWGPQYRPEHRFVSFSYSADLTERDNRKFKSLMLSHDYARLFGNGFNLVKTGERFVSNDRTGWKLATSIGGVGTGERGDAVVLDDPHNVKETESDPTRLETLRWFRESMSSRLNDVSVSAVVIIMQRVHEEDVAGIVLAELRDDYEHLMIPMEWDGQRIISTVPTMRWSIDPRTKVGELAWPDRFPAPAVRNMKITAGPYAWAGQYQQIPSPRGGGIFKRDWWMLWDPPPDHEGRTRFPACEYIVGSLDTAYTEDTENDYSALTIWGLFRDSVAVIVGPGVTIERRMQQAQGNPKIMLMHAWQKRLPMHGPDPLPRQDFETERMYLERCQRDWGLVEWTAWSCRKFGVKRLLIESKASGITAAQELRRQHGGAAFGVQLVDPGRADKVARAYSVQPLLAGGMIYAPDRPWADEVQTQMSIFPKGHDDLTDSATQAWSHLRAVGLAQFGHEIERDLAQSMAYKGQDPPPLYPA